ALFAYFFRREVEQDEQLARGLFLDGLQQLSASQAKAFAELNSALVALGGRFDQVFDRLDDMARAWQQTHERVEATHNALQELKEQVAGRAALSPRQQEGTAQVARLVVDILNRTRGRPTLQDSAPIGELCDRYGLPCGSAKSMVDWVAERWAK